MHEYWSSGLRHSGRCQLPDTIVDLEVPDPILNSCNS